MRELTYDPETTEKDKYLEILKKGKPIQKYSVSQKKHKKDKTMIKYAPKDPFQLISILKIHQKSKKAKK